MYCGKILLGGLTGVSLILLAAGGYAQEEAPPQFQTADPGDTLKERLSSKASDEQRVDNCKVPPDRRGAKIRPDDCSHGDADAMLTELPQ